MTTARQVEEALESDSSFYWGVFEYRSDAVEALDINGERYEFEVVETRFGQEGDWHANTYIVFRVGRQHFKKTGYYASHDGEYWDGPVTEVVGVPTTKIVWRDK